EQGITKRLRDDIYIHLQKLSLQYFHRSRTGNLISIAVSDVLKIHETFNNAINHLIRDPLLVLVYLAIMIMVSWQATLFATIVFPVILILIYQAGRVVRRYSKGAQEALADVSSSLEESINNVRIVRAYSAEKHELRRFTSRTTDYFRTMLKINRIRLFPGPINEILGVTAAALILWYGGKLVLAQQFLKPPDFLLFLFAMFSIINPAKSVSNVNIRIHEGLAAARRIFDLLDTKAEVIEVPNPVHLGAFADSIVYDQVYFEYDTGDMVLEDISFSVKKGEIVALVGPSGAGKSTLIDLLCRFHDPARGAVLIDGVDLRQVSFTSLRHLLGVVTQETILFNDTVANNIAYPSGRDDRQKLEQAAHAANADEFISQMPQGYDTVIGNRGMMVSGGQRQRLAIARALMKDPDILIFDEATSSLDTESERLVQEAIDRLMAGRTTIVIAHRLSTILHADNILVVKEGRIVEQGKHEELLRRHGVYRRLYDLQFENNHANDTRKEIAATGESNQGI
ncbi:MAG: ABC transporter ATP-binding protein, partial [candidate division Zixibacteria bacterium]|nr:ABC transporter ATP-binding protein [candidate division Zixibacteria bacterium]